MPKPVKIKNVSSSGFMSVNVKNKSIPNLEFFEQNQFLIHSLMVYLLFDLNL